MDLKDFEFWEYEELLTKCEGLSSTCSEVRLGEELSKFLTKFKPSPDKEHFRKTESWLSWCKEQKNRVKVSSVDIPAGILHPSLDGCLYDIKVSSKGPDDKEYNKHQDLRERVARGNSVLYILDKESGEIYHDGIIFALRKFTGGMGDEDESQPEDNLVWMKYFLKPLSSATTIVSTRKANGEAAHLSVRHLPRTGFVLCVGSKNVHMIVRKFTDVEKYSDSRFLVARTVANSVLDLFLLSKDLEPDRLTMLLNFLHHTRLTCVFEILQPHYQHVEDLSYLGEKSELNLITFTQPYGEVASEKSLCALSPDVALEFGRSLGFKTVRYQIIPASQAEERMEEIRKDYGYEGDVMYFLDSRSRVIGLVKKKTAWYVLARAIREKASAATSPRKNGATGYCSKTWERRINEIQRWLGFSDDFKHAWTKLGNEFIKWLVDQHEKNSPKSNVRGNFPTLWKNYLSQNELSDRVPWS